jgi:pimeloyl-ACP methyl ester carboxylesterase
MALLAEDACALLDHLGIETTAVWAVSAGCAIGLTLALSRPTRVSALVLSDGAPWFSRDDEMIAALVERLRILETEGAEAAYDARKTLGPVGPRIFSPASLPPSQNESAKLERQRELMRLRLASTSHSERIDGYAAELRTQKAYLGIDFSERLPELTMPLLAVNGTDDQVFPDVGWERFAERMPNLHCLSIEGGIHGCGQSPEAVRAILSFLETASE